VTDDVESLDTKPDTSPRRERSSSASAPVITPNRLRLYLEKKFADDRTCANVGVQGEVSNLKVQQNGNVYFSLKDREAC